VGTIANGTWNGANIAVTRGGTNANDAVQARTNLGIAIGTNVQAYSAVLGSVAGGTYTGATSITTVGTITSGTWNGTYSNTNVSGLASGTYAGSASITTIGTITTGTWRGSQNFGDGSTSNSTGDFVIANGLPSGWGSSEYSVFVSNATSVNNAAFELVGPSSSTINPSSNTVVQYLIQISARSTVGDYAAWIIKGAIKDTGSGSSLLGPNTKEFWGDSAFSGDEIDAYVAPGPGQLAIGGTGISGKTIRWTATSHLCWTS
jgi:hypothetical protein